MPLSMWSPPDSQARRFALARAVGQALAATGQPPRRLIHTRASTVVLTRTRAYKFTRSSWMSSAPRADAGARSSHREWRLNRSYAPEVYLGVLALVDADRGASKPRLVARPGPFEPVQAWVLCMRRLPQTRMLDQAIRSGSVRAADVERIAVAIAQLYRTAPRALDGEATLARFRREQASSRRILLAAGIPEAAALLARVDAMLARSTTTVLERVRSGAVIEAHGDLRPAHVCLGARVTLIDRLDFDARLRRLDCLEELGLLGLLCGLEGAPWIGRLLVTRGVQAGLPGAAPPRAAPQSRHPDVLAFYTAHHALVRARLAILRSQSDPGPRGRAYWQRLAGRYLGAADAAANGWSALG